MSSKNAMHQAPARGIIVSRLDEIILRAQQRWGEPVSASRIARATRVPDKTTGKMVGVNGKTLRKLASNETTRYDFHTLATLCWYFGCQVSDLLEYVAPGRERSPVPLDVIKREGPPTGPPPAGLSLTNHIAAVLAEKGTSMAAIAHLAHVKWDTLAGHTRAAHRSRIGQQTLANLCTALDVSVETLLTYEQPG